MMNTLVLALEWWYRSQSRYVIMYDHSQWPGCFIVSDNGKLMVEHFSSRIKAIDWCYNKQRGADDDSNV